jgi:hypothetical protein
LTDDQPEPESPVEPTEETAEDRKAMNEAHMDAAEAESAMLKISDDAEDKADKAQANANKANKDLAEAKTYSANKKAVYENMKKEGKADGKALSAAKDASDEAERLVKPSEAKSNATSEANFDAKNESALLATSKPKLDGAKVYNDAKKTVHTLEGKMNSKFNVDEVAKLGSMPCEFFVSCLECAAQVDCGWCALDLSCREGTSEGPSNTTQCKVAKHNRALRKLVKMRKVRTWVPSRCTEDEF